MSKLDHYREEQLALLGKMMKPVGERESIALEGLAKLEEPVVLFEYENKDSDGVVHYVYTVGGRIEGKQYAGALIGGECIVVHAKNRMEADRRAAGGLEITIEAVASRAGGDDKNVGVSVVSEASN